MYVLNSPQSRKSTEKGDKGHERDDEHTEGYLGDGTHLELLVPVRSYYVYVYLVT